MVPECCPFKIIARRDPGQKVGSLKGPVVPECCSFKIIARGDPGQKVGGLKGPVVPECCPFKMIARRDPCSHGCLYAGMLGCLSGLEGIGGLQLSGLEDVVGLEL